MISPLLIDPRSFGIKTTLGLDLKSALRCKVSISRKNVTETYNLHLIHIISARVLKIVYLRATLIRTLLMVASKENPAPSQIANDHYIT